MKMTKEVFQDHLQRVLEQRCPDNPQEDWAIDYITTFEDARMLTNNKGLVVQLNNGQRFQLTIVEA